MQTVSLDSVIPHDSMKYLVPGSLNYPSESQCNVHISQPLSMMESRGNLKNHDLLALKYLASYFSFFFIDQKICKWYFLNHSMPSVHFSNAFNRFTEIKYFRDKVIMINYFLFIKLIPKCHFWVTHPHHTYIKFYHSLFIIFLTSLFQCV